MKQKLEDMTIEQKLGMVFCARRFEPEDVEFIIELMKKQALGCVQLPVNRPEIAERILTQADYPILVITDAERGFPISDLPKIPLMSIAACDNIQYYQAFAKGVVDDAKRAGFNGNWGPVIDILRCDGPCKVSRHFSDNPLKVAKAAEEIAKIYKQNHHLSTGKHYPGGWDSPVDTHMVEGTSDVSEEELIAFDLVPYMYLYERDLLPSIMTGHTVFSKIDPEYPASLSKKVIDIIRRLGYDGLIFTDSLAMMGILQKFGEENAYGLAIAAGNDIILPNYRTPVKEAFEMLVNCYNKGAFTEEILNEAVRRVLAAQAYVGAEPENPTVFTPEDRVILDNIARDCITAITDEGVEVSLSTNDKERLFIITEETVSASGIEAEVGSSKWYFPKKLAEKIHEEFPESGIAFIPEFSGQIENEIVLNTATKYKEIVFVTYCDTVCYLGTDCLTRRTEAVLNSLIQSGKVSTVVHFGNPFALKTIKHVPRKIFGYTIPASQLHAIEVLAGKIEAKGTLPFEIDFM